MGSRTDKVFVVDVESTCWETRQEQGDRPNEIIEIGICAIDVKSGEIQDASGYVVKPRFTKVSPFCTQLTGWTQEQVDEGSDIADTLAAIRYDYKIEREHVWFSYGEYDRIKLSGNGKASLYGLYGIPRNQNPFDEMRAHFNIKTLMALKLKTKEMGMDSALKMLNLQLEGRHHNGCDDAYNIAKIVKKIVF